MVNYKFLFGFFLIVFLFDISGKLEAQEASVSSRQIDEIIVTSRKTEENISVNTGQWKESARSIVFRYPVPLVLNKISSGAKDMRRTAPGSGIAQLRAANAHLRCQCALPLRIFASSCAFPPLSSMLPSAGAHYHFLFGAFSLPSATFRWF